MFPLAHFTKQQLQEKEKELKGSWKAILDALKESGVSWNESLCMVVAGPDKWKKLTNDNGKMAKFQKKPFPLFEDCSLLYHGSVATGDYNFTSTEHLLPAAPAAPAAPTALAAPAAPAAPTALAAPAAPAAPTAPAAPAATTALSDSTSLFTSFDGFDDSSARNEAQSAPVIQESVQGARGGRKRKQSHIGAAVDDWVQYKKTQTSKALEEISKKKKEDEKFSVDKCLDEVDAMDGLTEEEKAYAMTIFKSEVDREVFMKMKNKNVRLIWLKQQISAISRRD